MSIAIHHVDAFTAAPFAGNPAAVCLLERPADAQWMQLVAREVNLPMTAFVRPVDDGFDLRWFTPHTEVDLCGHATLASAHVLWTCGQLGRSERARFRTRGGSLSADLEDDMVVLEFPAAPFHPQDAPPALLEALGASPIAAGRFADKRLLEVTDEAELRALTPDFTALRALDERAVTVTCRTRSPGMDFVSRNFAPWIGIDEDAVTGSSHCCLGPYWAKRIGKTTMQALQASARGGCLHIEVVGERVRIGGHATIVASGILRV